MNGVSSPAKEEPHVIKRRLGTSMWRPEPAEVATATAHPLSTHVGKLGNIQSKTIQKQGQAQSEGREMLGARLTKRRLQVRVVSGRSLNKTLQGIISSAGAEVLRLTRGEFWLQAPCSKVELS